MSNSNSGLKIGGLILCGGKSERMNYSKALLPWGDELMLQRVVRIVSSVVSPVAVVAAQDQELPELPEAVHVIHDRATSLGPLCAIGHGLETLKEQCDAVFVSGCDTPLITPDFIQLLLSQLKDSPLVMVREGDRLHPLAGVYRTSLLEPIHSLLNQQRHRLLDLTTCVESGFLDIDELRKVDPDLLGLRNVNSREQYLKLLTECGMREQTDVPFDAA